MAGINVEKLLKHLKKALDFLQKIPTLSSPLHEWSRKELIELLTKDMLDFENVTKAPMSHLNEGEVDVDEEKNAGTEAAPKRAVKRSPSKAVNIGNRLRSGRLTIEVGPNGEVIIRQGDPSADVGGKSQKAPDPEPEVDFEVDEELYDDEPDEPEKPEEKPKNLSAKFGSFLKKAKVHSPLPERKKAAFSGKLAVKIGVMSKPLPKHCAIKSGHLYYGSAENTPADGKIMVAGCSITEVDSAETPHAFEITSMEGTNFLFVASSDQEREDWVRELKAARGTGGGTGGKKDRSGSTLSATDRTELGASISTKMDTDVTEVADEQAFLNDTEPDTIDVSELQNALEVEDGEGSCERRGWMKRLGGLTSHKVWVVVSGPQLTIFRDDKEQEVREEYSIYGAKISTRGSRIDISMKEIKKGVGLAPVHKANLPDAKWIQVFAKAIQVEEDIYEEYISPDTLLKPEGSIRKGVDLKSTFRKRFKIFSKSEEVQGTPVHSGNLMYLEPKTNSYVPNYFTVVGDYLVHYRSQGDSQVLGRINLSKCYGMWLGPYGAMMNVLCLSHDGKKIHYFSVTDLDDVEVWLEMLGKALLDATWCSYYDDITNQEVSPGVKVTQVYQTIYAHPAECPSDLHLEQGDMVQVREMSGNAWLCEKLEKGMRRSGYSGYVTSAYLSSAYAPY